MKFISGTGLPNPCPPIAVAGGQEYSVRRVGERSDPVRMFLDCLDFFSSLGVPELDESGGTAKSDSSKVKS